MRNRHGYHVLFLFACFAMPTQARADPDPVALLRGVETAREPWRGKIVMKVTSTGIRPKSAKPRQISLEIEFDHQKRRFIQEEEILSLNVATPGQRSTPGEQYKAMGQDTERALALGIGKMIQRRSHIIYDGSRVLSYATNTDGSIADPKAESALLCFDPRIIGLRRNNRLIDTLATALGYGTARAVRLAGKETIRGLPVWHVVVVRPADHLEHHFWIEDREGYRVHRFEYRSKMHIAADATSCNIDLFYDRSPFPVKLESHEIAPNIEYKVTYTVERAELGVAPDQSVFDLAGLEMPPGTRVGDDRINQTAGYWDGSGLIPDRRKAVKRAVAIEDAQHRPTDWPIIAAVAIGGLVLLFLSVRHYRRTRNPTG